MWLITITHFYIVWLVSSQIIAIHWKVGGALRCAYLSAFFSEKVTTTELSFKLSYKWRTPNIHSKLYIDIPSLSKHLLFITRSNTVRSSCNSRSIVGALLNNLDISESDNCNNDSALSLKNASVHLCASTKPGSATWYQN